MNEKYATFHATPSEAWRIRALARAGEWNRKAERKR